MRGTFLALLSVSFVTFYCSKPAATEPVENSSNNADSSNAVNTDSDSVDASNTANDSPDGKTDASSSDKENNINNIVGNLNSHEDTPAKEPEQPAVPPVLTEETKVAEDKPVLAEPKPDEVPIVAPLPAQPVEVAPAPVFGSTEEQSDKRSVMYIKKNDTKAYKEPNAASLRVDEIKYEKGDSVVVFRLDDKAWVEVEKGVYLKTADLDKDIVAPDRKKNNWQMK